MRAPIKRNSWYEGGGAKAACVFFIFYLLYFILFFIFCLLLRSVDTLSDRKWWPVSWRGKSWCPGKRLSIIFLPDWNSIFPLSLLPSTSFFFSLSLNVIFFSFSYFIPFYLLEIFVNPWVILETLISFLLSLDDNIFPLTSLTLLTSPTSPEWTLSTTC